MTKNQNLNELEKRKVNRIIEMRAMPVNDNNNEMWVEGRAAVYNSQTEIMEIDGIKYYEVIDSGAFDGCNFTDACFTYNHSDNVMIMARTSNNTLQLTVDDNGLYCKANLAPTTAGKDLYTLIKRGDISKMSFAFTVSKDMYDYDNRTRHIQQIDKLYDVSSVSIPAYDNTNINISSRDYIKAQLEAKSKIKDEEKRKRLILMSY